jgi:molecular chaperone HscB
LQPFVAGSDHWAVLGLERRLELDRAELERRFHALNRSFHPDYFRLHPPDEQAISLENSAAVNTAYRVLREPVARVEYLLECAGLASAAPGQPRPPADLLEEIMELQEARQELLQADPDEAPALSARLAAARIELDRRAARCAVELTALFPRFDTAPDGERPGLLARMREILGTRAYLRTVLRDLGAALNGDSRAE